MAAAAAGGRLAKGTPRRGVRCVWRTRRAPREGGERMRGAPRGRSARRSQASRSIDPSNCRWFASRATRRHVASDAVRPEGTREGASE